MLPDWDFFLIRNIYHLFQLLIFNNRRSLIKQNKDFYSEICGIYFGKKNPNLVPLHCNLTFCPPNFNQDRNIIFELNLIFIPLVKIRLKICIVIFSNKIYLEFCCEMNIKETQLFVTERFKHLDPKPLYIKKMSGINLVR